MSGAKEKKENTFSSTDFRMTVSLLQNKMVKSKRNEKKKS